MKTPERELDPPEDEYRHETSYDEIRQWEIDDAFHIEAKPAQIGSLLERTEIAIKQFKADELSDIDVLVYLLDEWMIEDRENAKRIISLCEEIENTERRISSSTYQGVQAE